MTEKHCLSQEEIDALLASINQDSPREVEKGGLRLELSTSPSNTEQILFLSKKWQVDDVLPLDDLNLFINGRLVAQGKIVSINKAFGLRLLKLFS